MANSSELNRRHHIERAFVVVVATFKCLVKQAIIRIKKTKHIRLSIINTKS